MVDRGTLITTTTTTVLAKGVKILSIIACTGHSGISGVIHGNLSMLSIIASIIINDDIVLIVVHRHGYD